MGNASTVMATAGVLASCWVHLPGEGARTLAAIPCCSLLFLLQADGWLLDPTYGFAAAVPAVTLAGVWIGSAGYYILVRVGRRGGKGPDEDLSMSTC